jgi:hypothetical protein
MNPGALQPKKEALTEQVHAAFQQFEIYPVESRQGPQQLEIRTVRRGLAPPDTSGVRVVTLVKDQDGILRWSDGAVPAQPAMTRAGLRSLFGGEPVTTMKLAPMDKNRIADELENLDKGFKKCEPNNSSTLRAVRSRALTDPGVQPATQRAKDKKGILLFVHGTFSNNENLISELVQSQAGCDFLDAAEDCFTQVLAFDHYTLSRSPVLNALELSRMLASTTIPIDIVCHSRGGLVTRWFFEVMDRVANRPRRAALVGCPLGGTSLAAPDKLRSAIDLFTNIGSAIGGGLSLVPFLSAAGALMKICFSVAKAAANTPIIDAGVAMIPGLSGQSRVTNSFELHALNAPPNPAPDYYAVTSTFRPADPGWKFWRLFCDWTQAASLGVSPIFQEENDLVVDTTSMTEFTAAGLKAVAVEPFGPDDHVYHTVYFRNDRTIAFIRKSFGI